jgi:LDH2 family malate/lactate/ureidoglycolate dehydrogenase
VTGPLLRVPAEDHRALCTHDLTGLHPWGGTRAMVGTNPLAPGDAVDSAGVRATDAAAAVDGAISPFGGPKGYALGLMIEVLVATGQPTFRRRPGLAGDLDVRPANHRRRSREALTCLRPSADHAS